VGPVRGSCITELK